MWQLGSGVGLDFNNCDPVVISGANSGFEGTSSISDANGQLLFYTNSDTVWNNTHNMMPNGTINNTGGTLSQVLIIPKPQSPGTYYIVTTEIQATGTPNLQYHTVDMSLDGGLGDVSSANNVLTTSNVTEQVCATYHDNGVDIWLMAHEYGTNNFMAFLVTSTGISPTPIISSTGPSHAACTSNMNARGEMKFSPDGNKLAFNGNGIGGNSASNILCLLEFDNSTGAVSNPVNLPFSQGEFGLSFSPDNTKLYGATWKAFGFTLNDYSYLYQFDLSSNDPNTIIASKQIIDSATVQNSYGSLKIGPDGKVYIRYVSTDYIGVINKPNEAGMACDFNKNGLFIGTQDFQYGLNNYIEYVHYCNELSIPEYAIHKEKTVVQILDIMGRKIKDTPNTLMIFHYSDGTSKKVFRVE